MAIGTTVKVGWDATKVNRGVSSLKSVMGGLGNVFKKVAKVALGITAAFTGATLIYARKFAREMDRIGKLSTRLGESAESMQRIAEAAKLGGTDLEIVVKGIQNFVRNLIDAENGTGEYADAVAELGLNARALVDMPLEEQILAISDAYSKAGGSARALAAMQDLLGRGGPELAAMVAQGPAALAKQLGEATVVSERTVRAMELVNDTITKMGLKVRGVFAESIAGLIPLIETKLPELEAQFKEFGGLAGAYIAEGLSGNISPLLNAFKYVASRLGEMIFSEVAEAITNLAMLALEAWGLDRIKGGMHEKMSQFDSADYLKASKGTLGSDVHKANMEADIAEIKLNTLKTAEEARKTNEAKADGWVTSSGAPYYPLSAP